MANTVDPFSFPAASRQRIYETLQAEYERRITGVVTSGSSSGQSFTKLPMTMAELLASLSAFAEALGGGAGGVSQTRPNFAGRYCGNPLQCP